MVKVSEQRSYVRRAVLAKLAGAESGGARDAVVKSAARMPFPRAWQSFTRAGRAGLGNFFGSRTPAVPAGAARATARTAGDPFVRALESFDRTGRAGLEDLLSRIVEATSFSKHFTRAPVIPSGAMRAAARQPFFAERLASGGTVTRAKPLGKLLSSAGKLNPAVNKDYSDALAKATTPGRRRSLLSEQMRKTLEAQLGKGPDRLPFGSGSGTYDAANYGSLQGFTPHDLELLSRLAGQTAV